MLDVVLSSADDHEAGLVHLVKGVAESLEEQVDALVALQVADVQGDRCALGLGRQMLRPVGAFAGGQERGVLHPSHRRAWRVAACDVLERRAHGQDAGAPAHGHPSHRRRTGPTSLNPG